MFALFKSYDLNKFDLTDEIFKNLFDNGNALGTNKNINNNNNTSNKKL